ncbi:hypothetical protein [Salinibacter ruber]|uniref:hypothetical protein n=1 Tax=Salinibacter ruber TaxID=146919 RepID=UPI00216A09A5|nr:hypothetical protein [Salinibacter ruber]MCS3639210.1 hypothetical protein [Salinibacter ruber]
MTRDERANENPEKPPAVSFREMKGFQVQRGLGAERLGRNPATGRVAPSLVDHYVYRPNVSAKADAFTNDSPLAVSLMKIICRILSILFLLGGVVGGGLLLASAGASAASEGASAGVQLGSGFAILISFTSAVGAIVTGVLSSIFLWWMGNVHDYLQTIAKR